MDVFWTFVRPVPRPNGDDMSSRKVRMDRDDARADGACLVTIVGDLDRMPANLHMPSRQVRQQARADLRAASLAASKKATT